MMTLDISVKSYFIGPIFIKKKSSRNIMTKSQAPAILRYKLSISYHYHILELLQEHLNVTQSTHSGSVYDGSPIA